MVLEVEILAVHVGCHACGDTQRIDQPQHEDAFTHRVLEPLVAWWCSHRQPEIGMFEVLADGEYAEWEVSHGVDG